MAAVDATVDDRVDVLVLGAGTAGSALALALLRADAGLRVALVDRGRDGGHRIGESLPSIARSALRELGVWAAFEAQAHPPSWARRSCWGGDGVDIADAIADPHGAGWTLDRARFDGLLRDAARTAGASIVEPAQLRGLTREGDVDATCWRASIDTPTGPWTPRCRFVVDATGRAARLVRRLGGGVDRGDRLACWHARIATVATASPAPPDTMTVEAAADGWWYGTRLPDGKRLVAWHSDVDLPGAVPRDADELLARARGTRLLGPWCEGAGIVAPLRATAAHLQWAREAAGDGWLAVGDASFAPDPITSQGLLHALATAIEGADTISRHLAGDAAALPAWSAWIARVAAGCRANLAACYGMERRWSGHPFWRRRAPRRPAAQATPRQEATHVDAPG